MGATVSTLTGLAGTLSSAVGAVNSIGSTLGITEARAEEQRRDELRAQQDLALAQLQAEQKLGTRQAQSDAALDREKIALDAQSAEDERRKALKRAVARQRASFGSSGVGSAGGSSEAVLLGLFEESEDEKQKRENLDNLKRSAIDQDLQNRTATNTLRRTQLVEKQRLQRALI